MPANNAGPGRVFLSGTVGVIQVEAERSLASTEHPEEKRQGFVYPARVFSFTSSRSF